MPTLDDGRCSECGWPFREHRETDQRCPNYSVPDAAAEDAWLSTRFILKGMQDT